MYGHFKMTLYKYYLENHVLSKAYFRQKKILCRQELFIYARISYLCEDQIFVHNCSLRNIYAKTVKINLQELSSHI